MRFARLSDAIGHTPLVELPLRAAGGRVLLKLEKFNPGGSMKDRMARSMLEEAERSGRLGPGGTLVESSSGNTGTALAMLAAERGYRFVAVVDHHAARSKVQVMRAYGAQIVTIEGELREDEVATLAREALARRLAAETPGAVFLDQADNPANAAGYEDTLAEELLADTDAELDLLVGSVGTGGSLSGTARGLRLRGRTLHVVGVEPVGSIVFGGPPGPYYQSGTGTPGGVEVGKNVDRALLSEGRAVSDQAAFTTARFLARATGLLVGGAAGGVIHTALQVHEERGARTTVVLVGDGGEKYLDTVFDDDWLDARSLRSHAIERWLHDRLRTHRSLDDLS